MREFCTLHIGHAAPCSTHCTPCAPCSSHISRVCEDTWDHSQRHETLWHCHGMHQQSSSVTKGGGAYNSKQRGGFSGMGHLAAGVLETDLCTQIVAGQLDQGTGFGPHNGAPTELQSSIVTKHKRGPLHSPQGPHGQLVQPLVLSQRLKQHRRHQYQTFEGHSKQWQGGSTVAGVLEIFWCTRKLWQAPPLNPPPPYSAS